MKNKQPKVSVLIPSYNYAQYLSEAIDSVLAQSFKDFELIVVDNCSTDNTVELVNEYMKKDERIKLHVNEKNIGMYPNYNQALLLATGEYIKFLNADDKFFPSILERFVTIFDQYPNISLVTSARQYFGNDSQILKSDYKGQVSGEEIIFEAILKGNFIGEPTTVMLRRKNLTLGLFDVSLLMFADYDMWLRQLSMGDIYFVEDVLSYFRQHETQGTKELNKNTDKQVFNNIQMESYKRHAILTNRFSYDYTISRPLKIDSFFRKRHYKSHNFLFSKTLHKTRIRLLLVCINPFAFLRYFFRKSKF